MNAIQPREGIEARPTPQARFRFHVSDVTGTMHQAVTDLDPRVKAGVAAHTLAHRMALPTNVPWALRDDRGVFLDDERELGELLADDAKVSLVPRAHLG